MYCPQCGGTNDEGSKFCSKCGLDIDEYRQKWQQAGPQSPAQSAQPADASYGPATASAYSPPSYAPPAYGQQAYGQQTYGQQSYGSTAQAYAAPAYAGQYQYGAPTYQSPAYATMPEVKNYLAWAIITTFFFWPTGIVAIVNAAKVDGKLMRGDYAGAVDASKKAKKWSWISFIVAVCGWVLYIIFWILMFALASHAGSGYYYN